MSEGGGERERVEERERERRGGRGRGRERASESKRARARKQCAPPGNLGGFPSIARAQLSQGLQLRAGLGCD